jgi:hypothetical protein
MKCDVGMQCSLMEHGVYYRVQGALAAGAIGGVSQPPELYSQSNHGSSSVEALGLLTYRASWHQLQSL